MALSNFKKIGDNLSTEEFNGLISLLRHYITHSEPITIRNTINGEYGTYNFDLGDSTIIDTGIVISDETRASQPKVQLLDNFFKYSTYTLKLTVMHFNGVNILDNIADNLIEKETLELELIPNQWINIPLSSLEDGYIISLNAEVFIKHDKTEMHYVNGVEITKAEPQIIQTGETSDIYAQIKDYDGENYELADATGKTVYFFEKIEPTLKVSAQPSIIQTNDTSDIYAKVTDEDGSLAKNVKVYFYEQTEKDIILYQNDGTNAQDLSFDSRVSITVVDSSLRIAKTEYSYEAHAWYPITFNNSDNFLFECEIAKMGTSQSIAMYLNDSTTATGCWFAYNDSEGKFSGAITGTSFSENATLRIGDKVKIKQQNGVITLYHNNTVLFSKATSFYSNNYKIGHYTNLGREQYIKNIKIIDLSQEEE